MIKEIKIMGKEMNEKKLKLRKIPLYIVVIISIGLLAILAGCIGNNANPTPTQTGITSTTNTSENLTVANVNETPPNPITTVVAAPAVIKCELCHTNPQNYTPHLNGGKLCINCHGSQVHNIHIGEGTVNLDCKTCHGFPPTIPRVMNGTGPGSYSVCERCHAPPPNNTEPSYGNLIVIHLSRGKYCTNCHGTDIGAIHAAIIANATKSSGNVAITQENITSGMEQVNTTTNTTNTT